MIMTRKISILQHFLNHYSSIKVSCPHLLPAMHSTDCFYAENIYCNTTLQVQLCDKFEKPFIYFFYGKPVYKVSQNDSLNRVDDIFSPVCFIIDIQKLPINMIFPFDSGAFISQRYNEIFPNKKFVNKSQCIDYLVRNYLLGDNINILNEYISIFFGDNENYTVGNCILNEKSLSNLAIDALINLLKANGCFEFDDRSRTIELICAENVDLKKFLKAIIVPYNQKRNEFFLSFCSKIKDLEIVYYKTHYPNNPNMYNEVVFQKAYEYMVKENVI